MKKIFLLVALTGLLAGCNTIKIAMNSTSADGERRIMTSSPQFFYTKEYDVTVALGALIQTQDTLAGLVITCDSPIKEPLFSVGSRMLIRLSDDETITLRNMLDREAESHTETGVSEHLQTDYRYIYSPWAPLISATPYRVTSMVPEVYYKEVNNSYAIYPITYEQMMAIINKGVTKLRIETNVINLDMPYTNGVSGLMRSLVTCLIEGVKDDPNTNF